jgi:hypothetical protein
MTEFISPRLESRLAATRVFKSAARVPKFSIAVTKWTMSEWKPVIHRIRQNASHEKPEEQ